MKSERDESHGFSLIELLVVVVIALILMAISLPTLMGYFRFAKIRGATKEVTEEIERARYRAINRNVNVGVVFVVLDQTRYRVVTEDDLDPTDGTNWTAQSPQNWNTLTTGALERIQARPEMTLPMGVLFDPNCTSHSGGAGGAPTTYGFRFTRLGRPCQFDTTVCGPALSGVPGSTNYVVADAAGITVCLEEQATGFDSWVTVSQGGRVRSRQGFE
jgi:prepilin-type N-terminal cleavage/methylation domain-containing protein